MLGRVVLVLGFGLWLAGCESEEGTQRPLFCDGLCAAVERCEGSTGSSCVSRCVADRPSLGDLSEDANEGLGACIARMDCRAIYDEQAWSETFEACWDETRAGLRPTAAVRSFCGPFAQKWFECGSPFPLSECEQVFGMWAEGMLERAARCETEPSCDGFSTCVERVFGAP